ncbi:hypothetical protein, partial [Burkholderia pseudomallei]|uniref:hypothetical protein n=1 Tax=Burkholderia pseudomallei TaxID=28450 RepID=UPI001C83AB72
SSSSGIVQLKQPRPFSKIEMARRNQAGQDHSNFPVLNNLARSTCVEKSAGLNGGQRHIASR